MDHQFSLPEPPPPPPGSEPSPEPQAETKRPRSTLFGAIAVLAGVVAVVAALGAWIAAPGRCEGSTFTSSRFDYCVTAPAGWRPQEVNQQGQVYDSFLEQDGTAGVFVSASSLPQGTSLEELVEGVRSSAEDQGFVLDDSSTLTVDGAPAMQFDAEMQDPQGDPVAFRIVLVSRAGTYWIVRLQDTPDQFAGHASDLRAMLRSWRFI
jgi:hypothetical protein